MNSSLETFDRFLKEAYSVDRVQKLISEDSAFFSRIKKREIDGMYQQVADGLSATMWGNGGAAMARVASPAPPPLTAAMVVTVATLGGLEWLRHRKAAVAAAETEEDWKSLADEFWEWLGKLFRMWRYGATE